MNVWAFPHYIIKNIGAVKFTKLNRDLQEIFENFFWKTINAYKCPSIQP